MSSKPSIPELLNKYPRLQPRNSFQLHFLNSVATFWDQYFLYKDALVIRKAREVVPTDELRARCAKKIAELEASPAARSNPSLLDKELIFFQCLLEWFKESFFKWYEAGFCDKCNLKMKFRTHEHRVDQENAWLASGVELFQCDECGRYERFPRYEHPLKLLETRKGRSEEWRNCFTAICVAFDFEMRLVDDGADNLWNEVFISSQNRWVHCDCRKNVFDNPLIYEPEWDTSPLYIVAISEYDLQDVIWRYTNDLQYFLRKRKPYNAAWLNNVLITFSLELQNHLPEDKKKFLLERRLSELVNYLEIPKKKQLS